MPVVTDVEVIRNVYDLAEQGLSRYRIAKITGRRESTITKWLARPEKFSPHLDEVALERALNGDRKVFESLSNYERRVFWERAAGISYRSFIESREEKEKTNPWITEISARLGYSVTGFSSMVNATRARTAAVA